MPKNVRLKQTGAKNPKEKRGRPKVITAEIRKILVNAFHQSFTVADACKFARIGERTYYDECKVNEDFSQEMELAQLWPEKLIRSNIVKTATHDARIGLEYLSRKRKAEWSTRVESTNEHTVHLKPISERTLEAIKRFNGGKAPDLIGKKSVDIGAGEEDD